MADDEFPDDIDWSTALATDPTQHKSDAAITTGDDNDNSAMNQNNQLCQNQNHGVVPNGTITMQQQQQPMPMAVPALSIQQRQQQPADDDMEALRTQILHLQNAIRSKDETITDLQSDAQISQIESSHRIKTAEEEATRKIHLVQEELRRVKMEADKYKGSWVRSKKRVTELEHNGGNGKTTNRVSQHDTNQENNVKLSTFGFPTDIETRRVTPSNLFGNNPESNANECAPNTTAGQQLFESDTTAISGSKRKMVEQPSLVGAGLTTVLPHGLVSQTAHFYENQSKHDTVVQRLARHLIMRDEMGCYSLTQMQLSLLDVGSENNAEPEATANANPNDNSATTHHSMQQSLAKGEETRSQIRSILYQVMDTDGIITESSGSICKQSSSSGIFFILLTRLNSLFDNTKTQVDDDDINHLMEHDHSISCGSVPSMSVLHILRVMCDVLSLSAKARDDLRYWLYQSQQPLGSVHEQKSSAGSSSLSLVHSRIEGLSSNLIKLVSDDSKEALWTGTCRATLIDRGNEWDPMTMSQPSNAFFGILVALMKGISYGSTSFDLESKGNMTQLIREQATRLVLTLMSDAPHYRVESVKRTPYLWKFWFDSLFPTNSMNESGTEKVTEQVEDFFSLWEVVADGRGSGRKRCNRPMAQEASKSNKQKRSNNGTIRSRRREATVEQEEQLSVRVKCGIIQLLTHLVVSSSSVQQDIYQPTGSESLPLARRVLAAVLDEVDGYIVPLLSSSLPKAKTQSALNYLQLCFSCNQFILALSKSNEGIQMLRYQMRVESGKDGQTHWSHSAISCMALVLNSALSCAIGMEQEEFTPTWATDLTPYLNRIAEQCIAFFKTLQSFAHNQKRNSSKSKPPTFASLISEQHLVLLSCFQKLSTREHTANAVSGTSCLLWISDEMKYDVQVMMEEALYDDV
ncbi:hypothetical protein QTG54_008701 [Skeletonema marinoi]|uniref:Uncharacterized protein n=1 Tax=Skeletonema marinoi TaxID=267567 RepID=A0AAD9DAS3_9STRA|nr:hypothetical protein QTG54_008701 [Skeletonema marinoi]